MQPSSVKKQFSREILLLIANLSLKSSGMFSVSVYGQDFSFESMDIAFSNGGAMVLHATAPTQQIKLKLETVNAVVCNRSKCFSFL